MNINLGGRHALVTGANRDIGEAIEPAPGRSSRAVDELQD